jgi:site-specific DNA-methyltransferase (adenine-specific)
MTLNTLHFGDNIEWLKTLPDNSVDAFITDSPYGLSKQPDTVKLLQAWLTIGYLEIKGKGFMGKEWDAFVPQPVLWKECYRVLKPGGYCLSFFGTRTYDIGTLAMRLAGFEVRDCIQWIYGSGFPKSKSSLKPANEPIAVCRKPGPLVNLILDDSRIDLNGDYKGGEANRTKGIGEVQNERVYGKANRAVHDNSVGRWPSNVILDEETAVIIDQQTGCLNKSIRKQGSIRKVNPEGIYNTMGAMKALPKESYNDVGGASRFFYVAKASPSERAGMTHPTIKPVKLMTQLVKLYCPVAGIVGDMHMGSGPLAEAAEETGRNWIGCDNWQPAIDDFNLRMSRLHTKQGLFTSPPNKNER